jgi:hypothetical protein
VLRVTVEHRGESSRQVHLAATAPEGLAVHPEQRNVRLEGPGACTTTFRLRATPQLEDGRHTVTISGTADGRSCGSVRAAVWVADGVVTAFTCNQYEESVHRTAAEHAASAAGVVWTTGRDGFIEWTFELAGCRAASLTMDCGAHLDKPMAVRASSDGDAWQTLYEGPGRDRERTFDLEPYLGAPVRIRLLDLSDERPSGARVRSFRLQRTPVR